jgi:hypothetical protein
LCLVRECNGAQTNKVPGTNYTPLMITKLLLLLLALSLCILPTGVHAAGRSVEVRVSAGSIDRIDAIVSFTLPAELKGNSYALRNTSGQLTQLQVDSQRQATFVLGRLKADETKTFKLVRAKASAPRVMAQQSDNKLEFSLADHKVFSFVGKPGSLPDNSIKPIFLRGGYIHPIYTPSGRLVTDDYPSDHYHHHGIWFAWTKTQFEGGHPDFWNVGDGTGRVDFEKLERSWSGPVYAGFVSRQNYVALTGTAPKVALNEQWDVRLYNVGRGDKQYYLFDLVATQECATSSPLLLEEYRYGGMGVRGHRDWKDKSKVAFLTSEDKTRENGNATRGRWCYIYGPVDGQVVGIAILDHPANLRSPQPMRLNPDDPFFNYAPSQLGSFEIKPGEKFVLRYRYIVADGAPDKTLVDRLWNDYAHPPTVVVSVK